MAGFFTEAVARVPVLKPHTRVVLLALANRANIKNWKCWPSVQTIADDACISTRQVQRELRQLLAFRLVAQVGVAFSYGPIVYRLDLDVPSISAPHEIPVYQLPCSGSLQTSISKKLGIDLSVIPKDPLAVGGCPAGAGVMSAGHTNKVIQKNNKACKKGVAANASPTQSMKLNSKAGTEKQSKDKTLVLTEVKEQEDKNSSELLFNDEIVVSWYKSLLKASHDIQLLTPTQAMHLRAIAKDQNEKSVLKLCQFEIPKLVAEWEGFCEYTQYFSPSNSLPPVDAPNIEAIATYKEFVQPFLEK